MSDAAPGATDRGRLFGLAYRMLGSRADADDIVQEALLRLHQQDDVRDPTAWCLVVVSRLALDRLRLQRRQDYVGPWLPEPLVDDVQAPGEAVEALSTAFLLLLERLSPVERAVFLLREVYDSSWAEVGATLGKSEAACRQAGKRARLRLGGPPRFDVDPARHQEALERFVAACIQRSDHALLEVLAPDVELLSDGGGRVHAAGIPVRGAERVARFMLGLLRTGGADASADAVRVNGLPGLRVRWDGKVGAVMSMRVEAGRITGLYLVLNPDKLAGVAAG